MIENLYSFRKIDTPELLQEAYRLRFQVYCRECSFISETDYPQGYETDEFDQHSVHFGAFDLNEQMVGTVRLVLPACEKFPIEIHCPGLDAAELSVSRQGCAEISRLTISKLYRRKNCAESSEEVHIPEKPTAFIGRVSPIALGLCRAMYQECLQQGIHYCLALMEDPLRMLLRLHGFIFWPLGPEVNFYGRVTPHLISVRELEQRGPFARAPLDPDQEFLKS